MKHQPRPFWLALFILFAVCVALYWPQLHVVASHSCKP